MPNDVILPDGTRIRNVPDGTTREQLVQRLRNSGQFTDEYLSGLNVTQSPTTVRDRLYGGLEVGKQLLTGAVAEPVAGVAGVLAGVGAMLPGGQSPMDAGANAVRTVQGAMTDDPNTERGQRYSEVIGTPFQAIERYADSLAELGGRDPTGRAGLKATLLGVPSLLPGVPSFMRRRNAIGTAIREIEQRATELGIEFDSAALRQQTGIAAEGMTSETIGQGMIEVRDRLRALNNANRQHVDELYSEARATNAEVEEAGMDYLSSNVRNFLVNERGYDLSNNRKFRQVNTFLNELDSLSDGSPTRGVQLRDIDDLKKRIRANRPKGDDPWAVAHDDMIRTINAWENEMFERDMIRGDPQALQSWQDARAANTTFRRRFRDNSVVNALIRRETTVEDMRAMVFSMSKSGFGREAALTLEHMRNLLGADSPQWHALQRESVFSLVEPLVLGEAPDFRAFNVGYDKFVRNNDSAVRVLGLNESDLAFLRRITGAAERTGAAPALTFDMQQSIAQLMFGHSISQRGLLVRTAANIFRRISQTGPSERRAMLRDMAGVDPRMPMVPPNSAAYAAFLVSQMNQEQEE